MVRETKIDVSVVPFVLDTIPVIFVMLRNTLPETECRNHADNGRTAILRTRYQEKIPDAGAWS
jgi:hypothetical protein